MYVEFVCRLIVNGKLFVYSPPLALAICARFSLSTILQLSLLASWTSSYTGWGLGCLLFRDIREITDPVMERADGLVQCLVLLL